jgi:uncharacterized protein involved in cysteine biosynthesis
MQTTKTNALKECYIDRIRNQTSYPAFRSLVNITCLLLYILGALAIAGGILNMFTSSVDGLEKLVPTFTGLLSGIFIIIFAAASKEASFMLADIADSIADLNYRYDQK